MNKIWLKRNTRRIKYTLRSQELKFVLLPKRSYSFTYLGCLCLYVKNTLWTLRTALIPCYLIFAFFAGFFRSIRHRPTLKFMYITVAPGSTCVNFDHSVVEGIIPRFELCPCKILLHCCAMGDTDRLTNKNK